MSSRRVRPSRTGKRSKRAFAVKRALAVKRYYKNSKLQSELINIKTETTSTRKKLDFTDIPPSTSGGSVIHIQTKTPELSSSSSDLQDLETEWQGDDKDVSVSSVELDTCMMSDIRTPEPNISFISNIEAESIEKHPLVIEKDLSETYCPISGNRIIQVDYFINRLLQLQYSHSSICTFGKLIVFHEERRGLGLVSKYILQCSMCLREFEIYSEDPAKKRSTINTAAVWGTLAVGSTYAHMEEIHSIMDMPTMSRYQYKQIEDELGDVWKESLWIEMERAGCEEKKIATEKGQLDRDGTPFITVYLDGGWSKRSYGHNYNASSGLAVIIGRETGKVLWVGVRNKYCTVCARAGNKKELPGKHICFRNWTGSSSAMEADIIVEGFSKSEELHGLRFLKFIADGDSSVFAKIKEIVPYGRSVEKVECTNHVIKNYGKALFQIKNDKSISAAAKAYLTTKNIKDLQKCAQSAIYNYAHENINNLKEIIQNTPRHVFGDHSNCTEQCRTETTNNLVPDLQKTGAFQHICGALELIIRKTKMLIDKETNNRAESFMNVVARFNAGKRLNLVQKGSFQTRVYLSGLRYNKGVRWHESPWTETFSASPGDHFKKYMESYSRHRENAKRNKRKSKAPLSQLPDIHYGRKAQQPSLTDEEFTDECQRQLSILQVTEDEALFVAKNTVGQFDNGMYRAERQNRLTASVFGQVVKRRDSTPCHSLVKLILYGSEASGPAITYGKVKEHVARKRFEDKYNVIVRSAGLYIDREFGFLAASPDGLVGESHVIEIKCLYSLSNSTNETIENVLLNEIRKNTKCCVEFFDDKIQLKRNHNYYYQIQGQLRTTRRQYCYFILYINDELDIFVEEIEYDQHFWENVMQPKLITFYKECVLPEIVRGCIPRGQNCIDPDYILVAKQKQEENKTRKK